MPQESGLLYNSWTGAILLLLASILILLLTLLLAPDLAQESITARCGTGIRHGYRYGGTRSFSQSRTNGLLHDSKTRLQTQSSKATMVRVS